MGGRHPQTISGEVLRPQYRWETLKLEMTTKFNQKMYARMKAKKNEPLSSINQRRLRVAQKEVPKKALSTPTPKKTRVTSPTVYLEEITPSPKRRSTGEKGKEKI
ncbi:hypothetical protein SO802_017457 [Lithocarpus litseifolius]|uniref:Uncharacterized protein n=1 Tax=Lithocarpus litseifolius TaxID=425828 RepID=A0AAW2CI07_9ROSI